MAAIQRFGLLLVAPAVAAAPPDFAAAAGGCTVGDCAEGYGRFDMPKGGSYEGDFAAGKSHGFGILEYHTGATYRGAFVEGRREGYGSYVFEDGATFDGEYVGDRAGQESEIPNFKGSYLGRFPLVSAGFLTSDHLSERPRSVDAYSGTRARGTLTLKRR